MKRIFTVLAIVATLIFTSVAANAENYCWEQKSAQPAVSAEPASNVWGFYIAPKVGVTFQQQDDVRGALTHSWRHGYTNQWNTGLSVGYNFRPKYDLPFRLEVEYLYTGNTKINLDATSVDFDSHTVFFNAAYDFDTVPYVKPYITAGLGANWFSGTHRATTFAWNAGGGFYVPVNENFGIDLSARYVDLGRIEKRHTKAEIRGIDTQLAFRFTF